MRPLARHTAPLGIEHAEIELAVGQPARRRLLEPVRGGLEILSLKLASGIERSQVVHRHAVAGLGGAAHR